MNNQTIEQAARTLLVLAFIGFAVVMGGDIITRLKSFVR